MKKNKIFLVLFYIAALSLPFISPSHLSAAEKGPHGTIRVGIFPFEPFNFVDKDGVIQGLNADLLREIVKDEDWSITFVPGSWAEGLERLQNQEIDLMVSVAYTQERSNFMDFTYESVAELWGQVYLRPEGKSQNISDLAGRRVAIMRKDISGINFVRTAQQLGVQCEIIELATHYDVFVAVKNGDVEAGVAPQHFGLRHADEYNLVPSTILFSPFSIYFSSKKGTQHELLSHIDAHLSRWKKDKNSFFYQRQNYWLANRQTSWEWPPWLIYASLGSACAILLFASFSFFLNKLVVRKTRELQNSEVWHRTILQTAMDGFLLFDKQGRFFEVNQVYCRMIGYSSQELSTMNIADIDISEKNSKILKRIEKIIESGEDRFETMHRCKNGSIINVELSVQYNSINDGRLVAFVQDITDRKKLEDINVFLAQSSFGVTRLSFDTLAQYLAENLTMDFVCIDRLDPDGLTAHTVAVWHDGNFQDNISYALQDTPCGQLVNQEACCYPANVRHFFPKDQALRDMNAESYIGVTLFDHAGYPIGLIAVIGRNPLQNRKFAESALQLIAIRASGEMERLLADEEKKKLQSQLLHAQKMEAIGTLAGGIAHDFNNILGAILGYAEMAQEDSEPGSKVSDDLDRVIEAGNRAAGLVKQILAFSRQKVSESVPLDPQHIIIEAVKLLRPSLPSTIAITQQLSNHIHTIIADPTQIHQIVMNLCTNAFHAMEKTGGTLGIRLENRELAAQDTQPYPGTEPGQFVVLSISDTGPGISSEFRDRIFDPYFTTKGIGKGTGMGLAIVHGISKSLGGFVTCESTLGQGTVFRVFFPATLTEAAPALATSTEIIPTGKEHVLYVDDEKILTELGQTMLERLGYQVTLCADSNAALSLIQENPCKFDILITDQTMPGMTGFDLARHVLQIRPNLPIILCTGYSNLVDEETARQAGIRGFIMKPLAKKHLAELLAKIKNESNSQEQLT